MAMKFALTSLGALCFSIVISSAKTHLEKIGGDYKRPVWVTSPDHSAQHLFIVEQAGRVFVVNQETGEQLPEPFLDIREQVTRKGNEQGLLSIDFAPDYAASGRCYAYFTNKKGTVEIVRFVVNEPKTNFTCDPSTKEVLLEIEQPYKNHNGGYLEVGPDGLLYLGVGDGGAANDPKNNGQDLTNHLGKILRIDVSPEKGYRIPKGNPFQGEQECPEILAYGLRNPWRCCWDEDLFYIADVGQNKWEEVNVVSAEELAGANFGWRLREGEIETPPRKKPVGGPAPDDNVEPVKVYDHKIADHERLTGLSINGGYVYRGSVEELQGHYLFSDHVNPRIWSFKYNGREATDDRDWTDILARPDGKKFQSLASFGQDADKEVYLVEMGGGNVWKITN